jgi:hypothetical protein
MLLLHPNFSASFVHLYILESNLVALFSKKYVKLIQQQYGCCIKIKPVLILLQCYECGGG